MRSGADDVGAMLVAAEYLVCLEDDFVVVLCAVAHEAIPDMCCALVVLEETVPFERGAHRLHLRLQPLVFSRPQRLRCPRAGRPTARQIAIFLRICAEAETTLDAIQAIHEPLVGTSKPYLVIEELSLKNFEVHSGQC